jgi:hypothetical protein
MADSVITSDQLQESDAEKYRRQRRESQRERRENATPEDRERRRKADARARQLSRSLLSENDAAEIRRLDTAARAVSRTMLSDTRLAEIRQSDRNAHQRRLPASNAEWWERVAILNSSPVQALGLQWNRKCKICGIEVRVLPVAVAISD